MDEFQDFVFVPRAKTLGTENITEQVSGLFVGTYNHFYFFPESSFLFEKNYSSGTITDTQYSYQGQPIPKVVLAMLAQATSLEEFERFVFDELEPNLGPLIRIFSMEDISEFKVQAKPKRV